MAEYLPYLNLLASVLLAAPCAWLYYDGRGQRKTHDAWQCAAGVRLAWEHDVIARVAGCEVRVTILERAPALHGAAGASASARETVVDVMPPGRPVTPPDPPTTPRTQLATLASESGAAPARPRMRVEIRPTGFASERYVNAYKSADRGHVLVLDPRDVDDRESTMGVLVLDATTRAAEVFVEFPAERPLRGDRRWVPRALVLDLGAPSPPARPPAPVDTEGDRPAEQGSISPGGASSAPRTVADFIIQNTPPVALNTRTMHRINLLFWSKLALAAKGGVQTAHCNGPACDGDQAVCGCPCAPCDRRRTLRESATIEITGPQTAAELAERARAQDPTIRHWIQRRWHEKIAAAQEAGKDPRHCHGVQCMEPGEGIALCACKCDGCALIVDLLVDAEREIAGR